MRLASRVFFVILFLIGLAGALTTGAILYVRLLYLGAGVLLAAWLWTQFTLRGLSPSRHARSLRASVGDIFEETFEITNNSRMPHLWVEIENQSNIPLGAGSRLLTWIGGRETRSYLARTWLTRRGAYTLGPTTLISGDPLGLFLSKRQVPASESLLVLPLILPIADFPSPAGLLPGGKAIPQKAIEITPHASGVREYVTGDPIKRIHWPTTARRGKLMVKEFEQDPQAEIWLFLDAERSVHSEIRVAAAQDSLKTWQDWMLMRRPELSLPPSTLEYGITVCASLAHYFIRQRRAVGFAAAAPVYTVIPAERSERQEQKILENLAFVRDQGSLPLVSLVDSQAPQMPLGSSALLITPSGRNDVLLAVENLLRRGLKPAVLQLISPTFGGSEKSEEMVEKLQRRGVSVCKIYNNGDLGETLSAFAAQNRSQDNSLWRKAAYTFST